MIWALLTIMLQTTWFSIKQFDSHILVGTFSLSPNSHLWLCPDNSGIAIYNGYDGNTIFLRSKIENTDSLDPTSLRVEFSSSRLSDLLGLSELECTTILNQLVDWGILVGSSD